MQSIRHERSILSPATAFTNSSVQLLTCIAPAFYRSEATEASLMRCGQIPCLQVNLQGIMLISGTHCVHTREQFLTGRQNNAILRAT